MPALPSSPIKLDPSTLDDLIYASRTSDLLFLQESLAALSASTSTSATKAQILLSAIDPTSQNTLLHYPAANSDLECLDYLLSLLPDSGSASASSSGPASAAFVNAQNSAGNTPLHWAALNGHLDCVKALVSAGADPGILNAAGKDALWEAEVGGKEGGMRVVEFLEREGRGLDRGLGDVGEGGWLGVDVGAEEEEEDHDGNVIVADADGETENGGLSVEERQAKGGLNGYGRGQNGG